MPKLDDAYRDQMTEEEIIAFEADDEDAATEALDALTNADHDASDDDPDPAKGDASDDDPDPKGDDDTSPTGDDDPSDDDPAPVKDDDPAPKAEEPKKPAAEPIPDVKAAQAALQEARDKRKALRDQYDDGDLTDAEFDQQMEALDDAAAEAAADIKTAQRQIAQQQADWKQAGQAYLERYPGLKADGVIQALDKAVQDLAGYPSVAALPHDQFLERVHRKLIAEAEYTGLDVPAIGKSSKKAEKAAPKGDETLGKTPKTLASVPSSDVSNLDDSPYASLERLAEKGDPIAFEEAMMKLPPEKRDEFASMYIE